MGGEGGRNSKGKAHYSTTHSQNYNLVTIAKQSKKCTIMEQYWLYWDGTDTLIAFEIPKKSKLHRRSANFSKRKLKVCTYRAEIRYVGIFKSIHGLT